jgi:CRP-like cAMP-binding protein
MAEPTTDLFRNSKDFVSFSAGQTIFQEDEPGDVMYVVLEGAVDILINGKVINTVGPGGLLGELALIDTRPRSATAVAQTDCKLVPISAKRFAFLVQQTPNFALHVMRVMANRLRQMDDGV